MPLSAAARATRWCSWIDLLDAATERNYYTKPERLTEFLAAHAGRRTVVIDEIPVPSISPSDTDETRRSINRSTRNAGVPVSNAVQTAQVVAVGARRRRLLQHVQDRLVILVHQDGYGLSALHVQRFQQISKAPRRRQVPDFTETMDARSRRKTTGKRQTYFK